MDLRWCDNGQLSFGVFAHDGRTIKPIMVLGKRDGSFEVNGVRYV